MKLQTYLEEVGLTAMAFASMLGVKPSTVTRWLKGERYPSASMMQRIVEVTDGAVQPNDFFGVAAPAA